MAILCDYSGIAVPAILSQGTKKFDETLIRHLILNSLRMYNLKYRKQFGQMVVCCDGSNNWRRAVYPEYKQKRRDNRDEAAKSGEIDFDEFFRILKIVQEEIKQNIPWKVIHVDGAEADDVIATIVHSTQDFGKHDDLMIVSADHDFIQLHEYDNVEQFSPSTKKLIKEKDPGKYAFEQILRGCTGDGVPNILSDDKVFITEGSRQTPLTTKKIDILYEAYTKGKLDEALVALGSNTPSRFYRNKTVIGLMHDYSIPENIKNDILLQLKKPPVDSSRTFNYLANKRCSGLIPSIHEFFIK